MTKDNNAQRNLKKVGILVVHGIGRQRLPPDNQALKLMYSRKLYGKVAKKLAKKYQCSSSQFMWLEANYAHVFNSVQSEYYHRLGDKINRSRIRQIVIENLGDAAAYNPRSNAKDAEASAFHLVHESIAKSLKKIKAECVPNAPLIVLAHSLGGQVMIDFFTHRYDDWSSDYGLSLQRFITFGCNIPLFSFGQNTSQLQGINSLGDAIQKSPWWLNYYDRDDVLGYPLAQTNDAFKQLEHTGKLQDIPVNAGNIFTRWNTLSHMAYWSNNAIANQIAADVNSNL